MTRKPTTTAAASIDTTGMNAAQKAWATRRAAGWTHPGAKAKAPIIPHEPVVRANLAAFAAAAKPGAKLVDKPVEIAVAVETAPSKKRGGIERPRLAVRVKPAPKNQAGKILGAVIAKAGKPAAKKAKKAPAKKASTKRAR